MLVVYYQTVGGDHETRKYIAKKLFQAANKGERTLGALERDDVSSNRHPALSL
jgi:hypothetical protein